MIIFFFFIVNSFIIFFLINQTEAFIIRFFPTLSQQPNKTMRAFLTYILKGWGRALSCHGRARLRPWRLHFPDWVCRSSSEDGGASELHDVRHVQALRSSILMGIEAACENRESVEKWRRQRRSLERLPSHLADALLRRLIHRRLIFPSLLEYLFLFFSSFKILSNLSYYWMKSIINSQILPSCVRLFESGLS